MNDTISRRAAIDEIKEIYEWHDNVTKERIIEHFERLPSAERVGKWRRPWPTRKKSYMRICSVCGESCWYCGAGDYKFCPNCGARMDVPDNDVGETEGEEG